MSIPCRTAAHQIYHQMRMTCSVCGIPSSDALPATQALVSVEMVEILPTKTDQSFTQTTLPISKTNKPKAEEDSVISHKLHFSQFTQNRPPTPYPRSRPGAGLQELRPTNKCKDPKGLNPNSPNLSEDLDQEVSERISLSEIGTHLSSDHESDLIPNTLVNLRTQVLRLIPRIVHLNPGNRRLRKKFMKMSLKNCLPSFLEIQNESERIRTVESLTVDSNEEDQTDMILSKIKDRLRKSQPRMVSKIPINERLRNKFSSLLTVKDS
ncbi:hypothetical protein DFH28DRAFT_598247 [Melampsora americana]|nr:hypothetical protein DFH28DRAFT_598247 [Melampsora americana]